MKTNLIITIIATLIIGLGGGYYVGKASSSSNSQGATSMMTGMSMEDHDEGMKKMAEMMKSGGMVMQAMGTKYSNQEAVIMGKDMEMVGVKYMIDMSTSTTNSHSMHNME
jgi:hypothetical protein